MTGQKGRGEDSFKALILTLIFCGNFNHYILKSRRVELEHQPRKSVEGAIGSTSRDDQKAIFTDEY